MRDVFDAFVTDPIDINETVCTLWLDGHHVNEAVDKIPIEDCHRAMFDDDCKLRDLLYCDVIHQYRLYEKLEHYLMHPTLFRTQLLFQIHPKQQKILIERYYSLDGNVARWLLGKKLTTKLQKDVDEIAEKSKSTLKSCRRQLENLRRVYAGIEDRNAQGTPCSVIREQFGISETLASTYTCVLFLLHARFEVHQSHNPFSWQNLLYFSALMMGHWVPQVPDSQMESDLRKSSDCVENGSTCALRMNDTWPDRVSLEGEMKVLSVRNSAGLDLSQKMTSSLRDLKAHLINDTESLTVYKKDLTVYISRFVSVNSMQCIARGLEALIIKLLTIGAGLSQPKECKDLLHDLICLVNIMSQKWQLATQEIDVLFSALIDCLGTLDVWYLHIIETRERLLSSWERFLSVCRAMIQNASQRQYNI